MECDQELQILPRKKIEKNLEHQTTDVNFKRRIDSDCFGLIYKKVHLQNKYILHNNM